MIMHDGTHGYAKNARDRPQTPKARQSRYANKAKRASRPSSFRPQDGRRGLRLHQALRVVLVHQRLVQDLLVQRLARGDHREDVFVRLDHALEQHGPAIVVLEELLHLLRQLRRALHPDRVHAHRACERDEVGVRHARVRVPRVVEQIYGAALVG